MASTKRGNEENGKAYNNYGSRAYVYAIIGKPVSWGYIYEHSYRYLFRDGSTQQLWGALHTASRKRSAPDGLVVGESHPWRAERRSTGPVESSLVATLKSAVRGQFVERILVGSVIAVHNTKSYEGLAEMKKRDYVEARHYRQRDGIFVFVPSKYELRAATSLGLS
ncbi:uncharacterized protein CC84DRAFT_414671 [Paraphaeosphaeria sporulosa]|uniref:Uncharacterized protein n=1 Tax=Paraphaeosphaeria sporulosa TaxID=1460663 RepID=A0A177BWZ1_9PLEO|nr:uncharacterized protein CC84DRAFT_414671 [Paraphaeosphaeria sporulosa]OAF99027.1 hypothetical protein CC84DRAFT_414671 [Paraphaeosphaeria sporulosa]